MDTRPSARASALYSHVAPKARQVVDLIRNKDIGEALAILQLTPRAASSVVEKVVEVQLPMLRTTMIWIRICCM